MALPIEPLSHKPTTSCSHLERKHNQSNPAAVLYLHVALVYLPTDIGMHTHSVDLHYQASSMGEEGGWETIVGQDGIKPAMGLTSFHSKKHGFRLWVQPDSVPMPLSPGHQEVSGPIRVRELVQTVDFEGGKLGGVLEVECLPCGRRFDAPLLLDFLVDGGNKEDPIIDAHGRIQYEVSL